MILAIELTSVNSGLFTDTTQLLFQIKPVWTGNWWKTVEQKWKGLQWLSWIRSATFLFAYCCFQLLWQACLPRFISVTPHKFTPLSIAAQCLIHPDVYNFKMGHGNKEMAAGSLGKLCHFFVAIFSIPSLKHRGQPWYSGWYFLEGLESHSCPLPPCQALK